MKILKFILIFCLITLSSCATVRYRKEYNEKRGLMMLEVHEYPRNHKMYEKTKKIRKTKKKLKKENKHPKRNYKSYKR